MSKLHIEEYLAHPHKHIDLKKFSTKKDKSVDKKEAQESFMPENLEKMKALQERLYAENRQALLIVFQAMDAAGKDGAIKHVMSGLNPQGTTVVSFKQPSALELDHDYLWRISKNVPVRGNIGIFNRSHYEDVIITRVHDLLSNSQLPENLITGDIWDTRYRQINDFERYLSENGIRVIKFYLHLSYEEQAERLLDRINRPEKNWKFSSSDIHERKYWEKYQHAYEHMLTHTSTEYAPWYIIPADHKWFTRYLISEIVLKTLEDMNPQYPTLNPVEQENMKEAKRILEESLKKEGSKEKDEPKEKEKP